MIVNKLKIIWDEKVSDNELKIYFLLDYFCELTLLVWSFYT